MTDQAAAPGDTMTAQSSLRMDAYYYSFTETGVRSVDEMLSAVAVAGKAYHHTEGWTEVAPWYNDGKSYVDHIQDAAARAAAEIARLRAVTGPDCPKCGHTLKVEHDYAGGGDPSSRLFMCQHTGVGRWCTCEITIADIADHPEIANDMGLIV